MFGKTKRSGLFGGGIVATPEQEAESARLAQMLGMGGANGEAPPMQQPEAQQMQQPRGMFGGGTVRAIAGTIGDTLLQHNGMDPVFAPAMQAQREAAAELANEQRKRSMGLEDYEAKKVIDQRYQAPGDTIDLREDNAGNVWQFDKRTGQPISDKPVWVDKTPKEFVHEGMRFSIRNPYGAGDGPDLDGTPVSEDGHTYTPGPGGRANPANWKPEGDAGSNASGGFREAFAEWN